MKTTIFAAVAALSLGIGSAYAQRQVAQFPIPSSPNFPA